MINKVKFDMKEYGMTDELKICFSLIYVSKSTYDTLMKYYKKDLKNIMNSCFEINEAEKIILDNSIKSVKKIYDKIDISNDMYLSMFYKKETDEGIIEFNNNNPYADSNLSLQEQFLKMMILKKVCYFKRQLYCNIKEYFKYHSKEEIMQVVNKLNSQQRNLFNKTFSFDLSNKVIFGNLTYAVQDLVIFIYLEMLKNRSKRKSDNDNKNLNLDDKSNKENNQVISKNDISEKEVIKEEKGSKEKNSTEKEPKKMKNKSQGKEELIKRLELNNEEELITIVNKMPELYKEILCDRYGILTNEKTIEETLKRLNISRATLYKNIKLAEKALFDIKDGKEVVIEKKEKKPKVEKEIKQTRRKQETLEDLADRLGISVKRLNNIIDSISSVNERNAATLYYKEGIKQKDISDKLNLSPSRISIILKNVSEYIEIESKKEPIYPDKSVKKIIQEEKEIIDKLSSEETQVSPKNEAKVSTVSDISVEHEENLDGKDEKKYFQTITKQEASNMSLFDYLSILINDTLLDGEEILSIKQNNYKLFTILSLITKRGFSTEDLKTTLLLTDEEIELLVITAIESISSRLKTYMDENKKEFAKRFIEENCGKKSKRNY